MNITQTSVFTRANTSISWPGTSVEPDTNSPFYNKLNFSETITYSNTDPYQSLTKTVVRVWTNKDLFISDYGYSNTSQAATWHTDLATVGLTHNQTLVTTE